MDETWGCPNCPWEQQLRSQGEWVLRMPPVKEPDAVHGVQDNLHALLAAQFPATMDRRVLEHQPHSMVAHVCTHVDGKQGEYHAHDNWNKDEVEGGDLQKAAVLVRVGVNIFILSGRLQSSPPALAL